jgi:hypothetical protein
VTSSSSHEQPETSSGVVATPGQRDVKFLSYDDGVFTVQGTMDLAAPATLLYELLTDYECAPRVFGNVTAAEVHARVPGEPLRVTQVRGREGRVPTPRCVQRRQRLARHPVCCGHAHAPPATNSRPHTHHRRACGRSPYSAAISTASSW